MLILFAVLTKRPLSLRELAIDLKEAENRGDWEKYNALLREPETLTTKYLQFEMPEEFIPSFAFGMFGAGISGGGIELISGGSVSGGFDPFDMGELTPHVIEDIEGKIMRSIFTENVPYLRPFPRHYREIEYPGDSRRSSLMRNRRSR